MSQTSRADTTNTCGDDDAGGRGAVRRLAGRSPLGPALALAGLLAGAAGLAVAEVLGRLVPGGASPALAIANRVIDLTPALGGAGAPRPAGPRRPRRSWAASAT